MAESPAESRPQAMKWWPMVLVAIVIWTGMAALSAYRWSGWTVKTTEFFGAQTVEALQVSTRFEIGVPQPEVGPFDETRLRWTDLSGSPGLSLMRRGLLEEGHYNWDQIEPRSPWELAIEEPHFAVVRLSGEIPQPPAEHGKPLEPIELVLELSEGWVGLKSGGGSVRLTDRAKPAIRNFIETRKDAEDHPL